MLSKSPVFVTILVFRIQALIIHFSISYSSSTEAFTASTYTTVPPRTFLDNISASQGSIFQNVTQVGKQFTEDRSISKGHLKFALSVYRELAVAKKSNENLVYSPVILAEFLTSILIAIENSNITYANTLERNDLLSRVEHEFHGVSQTSNERNEYLENVRNDNDNKPTSHRDISLILQIKKASVSKYNIQYVTCMIPY